MSISTACGAPTPSPDKGEIMGTSIHTPLQVKIKSNGTALNTTVEINGQWVDNVVGVSWRIHSEADKLATLTLEIEDVELHVMPYES